MTGSAVTNSAMFIEQIGFPSTRIYVRAILRRKSRYARQAEGSVMGEGKNRRLSNRGFLDEFNAWRRWTESNLHPMIDASNRNHYGVESECWFGSQSQGTKVLFTGEVAKNA
jgi:hypothetical protein